MPLPAMISGRSVRAGICTLGFFTVFNAVAADVAIRGRVLDDNGRQLAQAMVTVERHATEPGVAAVSVFTDAAGEFVFPMPFANARADQLPASAKLLGYRQVNSASKVTNSGKDVRVELTLVLSRHRNQAGLAPASAWLGAIANLEDRAALIMNCIGCHQLPAPEVRDYARAIDEVAAPDPAAARLQSWQAMAKYMNFLSAEEFGRGNPNAGPVDADRVYGVGDEGGIAALLAKHIQGPLDRIEGYQYGAPLAVTPATVIREYAIDTPNNVREALMIGSPPKLWGADVASNNVVQIDVATGQQRIFRVPSEIPVGPHTLVRGHDNSLWVAPFFNGVVSRLDPVYGDFQVWNVRAKSNPNVGIHDLSFDYHHELVTDQQGRIWYSDITNNAVGYFHPQTDAADIYRVPEIEGRPGRGAALYGLVMTSDHKYVWYTQFGIGSFGCFNTETMQFETSVSLPLLDSGPRRIAISDQDILYVPLYGAGQLIEYDTRNRRQIGIYDLPDRASAPYAVTWDNVRQVVWIPTSNANVVYRFDPRDKSFNVLPLPREQAFLRMVGVEPETGVLVSAYGNIVETVHGPRMAVVIDPGDDYPAVRRARQLALGGRE